MKLLYIIATWLLFASNTFANSSWTNRFISYKDGLPATKVNDIIQDSQGYIWMGSDTELCRFDGAHILNFEWLGYANSRIPANVGNLYLDEKNQLLWIRSRKYTYRCYNLRTGHFISYGSEEQQNDGYRRMLMTDKGMWLCDAKGIRNIMYHDGKLSCIDYRSSLGNLPQGDAMRIMRDTAGNIWGIVGESIIVISPNGKMTVKARNVGAYRMATWKDYILFLTKKGKLFMYNSLGKLVRTDQMPKDQCDLGSQNSGFIWNNKWVMLTSHGTHIYDLLRHTFCIDASLQMETPRLLDNTGNTYFVGSAGTLCVFAQGKPMLRLPLLEGMNITGERNRRFSSVVGTDGRYYIATFGNGLFIYNPKDGSMEHHRANDLVPLITSDFLTDIMLDKQGNVWLLQEESGVVCIGKNNGLNAQIYIPVSGSKGGWRNNVCFLSASDKAGNMLVGTRDNQYYSFSPKTGKIQLRGGLSAAVFAYLKDSKGREWLGTRGDGLHVNGQRYIGIDHDNYIPTTVIHDLKEDGKGRVWAATMDAGLLAFTMDKNGKLHYKQFLAKDVVTSKTERLFIDKKGVLWIACDGGLISLDTKISNVTDKSFVTYKSPKTNRPFEELNIVYRAKNGTLWAGSLGHGLYELHLDSHGNIVRQNVIDRHSGLHGNHITSITEDRHGNIWVGTSTHISRIDSKTGRVVSYEMPGELEHAFFSRGGGRLLNDGRLVYATSEGLMAINPDNIQQKIQSPYKATVTDVIVNGKSINSDEQLLECLEDGNFRFPHDYNNLKMTYSNFDYSHKTSILYQYWLEGRDKSWNEPTTETTVSYDKLTPGKYVFHIRALGNGEEVSKESSLVIVIEQPWWNTWWAWTLYLIIIGVTGWVFYRNWKRRFDLQQEMKLQQQVTDFRLEFFTHVTHEFRTPLSIISGAVDKMSANTPETVTKKTIQTIKRGSSRLRQLVDRLMEFRKISTGNVTLQVEQGDLVPFLKDIMQDFWTMTQQKQQTLSFTPHAKQCIAYFDRHIIDTIVYNLLSNAVKYTPEKGRIDMRLSLGTDNTIVITIEDNGPGISAERQKDMFSPFMHGYASAGGMGIGLYTAKQMALTHKGTLEYQNTGHGSVFTLAIPANDSLYDASDYCTTKVFDTDDKAMTRKAEEIIRELQPNPMNNIRITVIEDELDMLEQLHDELSNFFIVDTYSNGNSGLEGILEHTPSLVVCDVMLPDINGYDVVRKLKADNATAQIPVILLTALDDADHQIKGYKAGADDYMVKPCNIAVLVSRIAQLIQWNRLATPAEQQMKNDENTVSGNAPANNETKAPATEGQVITSKLDRVFIDRLEALVEQHASDSSLSVDSLAEMMHMGRTKFYGQCRKLMGMSPNKYILQVRMIKAGEMLLTGEMTIAEVCYALGFSDPSHFNKCFKAHYGMPPSKYGKS